MRYNYEFFKILRIIIDAKVSMQKHYFINRIIINQISD